MPKFFLYLPPTTIVNLICKRFKREKTNYIILFEFSFYKDYILSIKLKFHFQFQLKPSKTTFYNLNERLSLDLGLNAKSSLMASIFWLTNVNYKLKLLKDINILPTKELKALTKFYC